MPYRPRETHAPINYPRALAMHAIRPRAIPGPRRRAAGRRRVVYMRSPSERHCYTAPRSPNNNRSAANSTRCPRRDAHCASPCLIHCAPYVVVPFGASNKNMLSGGTRASREQARIAADHRWLAGERWPERTSRSMRAANSASGVRSVRPSPSAIAPGRGT